MVAAVFTPKDSHQLGKILLSCDVAWWVRLFLEEKDIWDSGEGSINRIFCSVHRMVSAKVQILIGSDFLDSVTGLPGAVPVAGISEAE